MHTYRRRTSIVALLISLLLAGCDRQITSKPSRSSLSVGSVYAVETWNPEDGGYTAGNFAIALDMVAGLSGVATFELLSADQRVVGSVVIDGEFTDESVVGAFDNIDCFEDIADIRGARLKSFEAGVSLTTSEQQAKVGIKRSEELSRLLYDWDITVVANQLTTFDRAAVVVQSNKVGRAAFFLRIPAGRTTVSGYSVDSSDLTASSVSVYRSVVVTICGHILRDEIVPSEVTFEEQ